MIDNTPVLVHSGREVMYNLFYRTFIDSPDEDLYGMLVDLMPMIEEFADGGMRQGVLRLNDFTGELAGTPDNYEDLHLKMRCDYTRIMCLTDSVMCTESCYTSPEHLAMQEARDEVLKYYSDFGMKKSAKYKEDEDFVANEMRFMSHMAQLTTQAQQAGDSARVEELIHAQCNFLREHPMRWIPQFARLVNTFAEAERFYGPIALIMNEFIMSDFAFLEESLSCFNRKRSPKKEEDIDEDS